MFLTIKNIPKVLPNLNIQDIILLVNIILTGELGSDAADMNADGAVNILDVIELVNLILN